MLKSLTISATILAHFPSTFGGLWSCEHFYMSPVAVVRSKNSKLLVCDSVSSLLTGIRLFFLRHNFNSSLQNYLMTNKSVMDSGVVCFCINMFSYFDFPQPPLNKCSTQQIMTSSKKNAGSQMQLCAWSIVLGKFQNQ